MKKLFLCVAVAALGFTNVNAQEVKFGAKAGVNFATLGGDAEDFDSRTSFHVGAVAEIMISEKFSFQPELVYSSQGGKEEYTENDGGGEVKYEDKLKLDYINLPLIAKYYIADGFSLEVGPQIGFLISANAETEISSDGESVSVEADIKDEFESIDFAFGIGTSYRLESGLNFSARYNLGISNIAEEDGDDFSVQNNVFQVSVGFFF